MMKTLLGLGAGALLSIAASGAQAMPVAQAPGATPLVEHVAEGCGPGYFRGGRGFCRPMRGFGPRPFFGPRRFERRLERRFDRRFDRRRFDR